MSSFAMPVNDTPVYRCRCISNAALCPSGVQVAAAALSWFSCHAIALSAKVSSCKSTFRQTSSTRCQKSIRQKVISFMTLWLTCYANSVTLTCRLLFDMTMYYTQQYVAYDAGIVASVLQASYPAEQQQLNIQVAEAATCVKSGNLQE